MIRVGIIGGIGSGKSFISKLFRYPVFNADNEVKYIYRKNKDCFNKITEACKELKSKTDCPDDDVDRFLEFTIGKWY